MHIRHWSLALLVVLVTVAVLVPAQTAWASDPPPADAAGHGDDHKKPGLVEVDLKATLTAIGIFLILLFVLKKAAWGPMLAGLHQREETIKKAVDDAQEASEAAQKLVAEYEAKLNTARDEARAIADEARKDAADVARRIEEEARERADETVARSVKEIEQAKDKAYDALIRDVAAVATEAASRIVRRDLTPEDNAALVDEVVSDFAANRAKSGGA